MIQIYHSNGHHIGYNHLTFSGGEEHIRLKHFMPDAKFFHIKADLRSSQDVMKLAMICDALDQFYGVPRHLVCPYVPYARQDRVCNEGEPLAARVMCDLINSLNFASVEVWDPHSDVVPALLRKCRIKPASQFVHQRGWSNTVFVAPDAGATKRVLGCTKQFGHEMVTAGKVRDTKTGAITATTVQADHIGTKSFLMIDDICDGGRTFIELAHALRGLTDGQVLLYVTHGIFSQGLDPFRGVIDHIYTPNSWLPHDPSILTILPPGDPL